VTAAMPAQFSRIRKVFTTLKLNLLFCQKPFSLVHYIAEVSRKVQCLVDSTFFGCDIAYFMAASAAAARSLS
jgi:hypothetical protein